MVDHAVGRVFNIESDWLALSHSFTVLCAARVVSAEVPLDALENQVPVTDYHSLPRLNHPAIMLPCNLVRSRICIHSTFEIDIVSFFNVGSIQRTTQLDGGSRNIMDRQYPGVLLDAAQSRGLAWQDRTDPF